MSANIELPSHESLNQLAPEKDEKQILQIFNDVEQLSRDKQLPVKISSKARSIRPA